MYFQTSTNIPLYYGTNQGLTSDICYDPTHIGVNGPGGIKIPDPILGRPTAGYNSVSGSVGANTTTPVASSSSSSSTAAADWIPMRQLYSAHRL